MSINITVHGSPVKCGKNKRYLLNDEQAKREQLEERKKIRLKQVREKSNEVAQQVRRNVGEARRKQLQAIEETKAREMKLDREEKLRQKREEYQNTLEHVGESHRAAAEQNCPCPYSEVPPVPCRQANDKWVEIRPTEPKKRATQPNMSYNSFCRERAQKRVNKENFCDFANTAARAANTQRSPSSARRAPPSSPCERKSHSYSSENSTRATQYSPFRRATSKRRGKKFKKKLVKTPSVILEIDSEGDSSGLDVEDTREDSNMKFSRVCHPTKQYPSATTICGQSYNVSDYRATDSSSAEQIPLPKIRFTQISDLIKQHDDNRGVCTTHEVQDFGRQMCADERIKETSSRAKSPKEKKAPQQPTTRRSPSPPRSPPKPIPEPPKRISSLKSTSKVSTKIDGSSQVTNRVQFFDYRNKFQKSYPQPKVVRNEEDCAQPNAMQQAEEDENLAAAQLEHLKKLRQKCESRSQKALEREQIRRDYEDLTAKLEALSKGKTKSQLIPEDAHLFSEARLKQVSMERQGKMNNAVEIVLRRPVLITCPEVEKAPQPEAPLCFGRATERDLNVSSNPRLTTATEVNSDSWNTSDSCASILLNYVNSQSKQISDDIGNCDNSEKVKKLKDLLEKINSLRTRLMEELEKTKGSEKVPDIKEVVDGIGTLRKERETILLSSGSDKEKKLDQREKKLKKREEILDKILQEFYEMAKDKTTENSSTTEGSSTTGSGEFEPIEFSPKKIKTNKPLEIIIKLKDEKPKAARKSPYKTPHKRSTLINSPRRKKVRTPRRDSATDLNRKLEKCHADLERCQADLEKLHTDPEHPPISQSVECSTSTSYRSPPSKISPPLNAVLEKGEKKNKKSKETQNVKPQSAYAKSSKSQTASIKSLKPPPISARASQVKHTEAPLRAPTKKNLNPVLVHYIQRLLGMSRGSIEMLGVSTSEVDTPSSSIINASANKSETESILNQRDKIQRLEKFIQDSYSFASEIETSLRSMKSASSDSSLRAIEEIWKRMLKQKQEAKQSCDRIKSPKPILKRGKPKQFPQTVCVDTAKSRKSDDSDKVQLVSKYTELTETCTKRIAELTEMINKVRQEKQRILEITLSSASASARSTTEYVDFAEKGPDKPEGSSRDGDGPRDNVQVDLESDKGRLEKNKLTGVSRDSGISMSRPMTALDFRDSPALQISAQSNVFEPILKDIPKPTKLTCPALQPVPQKAAVESSKKGKPPATMARYSPQLDELPHELSTIIEVDTTPRISISNIEKQLKEPMVHLEKEMDNITYSKFPTFEEYIRRNKIDITLFDPEISSKLQLELQELLSVANAAKEIQYKEFPVKSKEIDEEDEVQESIDNLVQSLKLLNLSMKRFPTHQEYLEQLQSSNIMHSTQGDKTSENVEDKNKSECLSIESLPDIVGELIRRKMMKQSFRNINGEDNRKNGENGNKRNENGSSSSKSIAPQSTSEEAGQSQPEIDFGRSSSPRKRTIPRRNTEEDLLSGLEMLQFSSNPSNSDNIEKELEGMGLKWAALMLRKSQHTQDIPSSSTSSDFLYTSRRKSGKKQSISMDMAEESRENRAPLQESFEGRPLNLRDFLAKELQKRTQHSSSSSSTDDSLASQFLRSMFGSEGSSSENRRITSNDAPISEQHTNRILTSTPVPAGSTSMSKPSTNCSSQKLFGAESLSTVRYSHSDSDGPINSAQKLVPPNVRLESKTINSSSSNRDS